MVQAIVASDHRKENSREREVEDHTDKYTVQRYRQRLHVCEFLHGHRHRDKEARQTDINELLRGGMGAQFMHTELEFIEGHNGFAIESAIRQAPPTLVKAIPMTGGREIKPIIVAVVAPLIHTTQRFRV